MISRGRTGCSPTLVPRACIFALAAATGLFAPTGPASAQAPAGQRSAPSPREAAAGGRSASFESPDYAPPSGVDAISPDLVPPNLDAARDPNLLDEARRALPVDGGNRLVPADARNPGRPVIAVEIVGNKKIERKKILAKIKVREGHTFDEEQIERDVRELNRSGMFVDVRPKSRFVGDGVVVVFEVSERPTIEYVKIVGNDQIRDKKLLEKIGLKVGGPLSPYEIEEGRRKIEDFYRDRGYNRAHISILEGTKPTDKGVIYLLSEGQSQKIVWTSFVGNTIVSDARLKTQIQSKPGVFWLFGGEVNFKKIEEDEERLTAYYRSLGYFRAKVQRALRYDEDRKWLTLTFVIYEGERYKIRSVSIKGNEKIATARLSKELQLTDGQFFDQGKLNKDVAKMLDEYGGEGFVFADVKPDPRFLEEPGELELVYNVVEGDRYRIGDINVIIEGENPHTRLNVVKNNIHLRPGDIADIREIREAQRRLMRAGVFERQDPTKMPQLKFSRPEDGETSVVGRGGVRKVRGQSPDDDSRTMDLVYVYETPDGPPTLHAIVRGLPREAVDATSPHWRGPRLPATSTPRASGYAPDGAALPRRIETQHRLETEHRAEAPRASYYDRPNPAAAARRYP
ncbi:MAG: POTRA domain-containing protein [Pirellulales bacterium]